MYQRILVPVDGSDTSNKALVAALQLVRDGGGSVRLAHVLEDLTHLAGYEQFGEYSGDLPGIMRKPEVASSMMDWTSPRQPACKPIQSCSTSLANGFPR